MNIYGPLTVPATGTVQQDVGAATTTIVVVNLSANLLYVQTTSSGPKDILPPWTGDRFDMSSVRDGTVIISANANNTTSAILMRSYFPGDLINGTYPYAVVQAVAQLPNQQTLINDGSAIPTTVIEITGNGEPQSNMQFKNNGNVAISGRDNNIFELLWSIVTSISAAATIGIGAGISKTTIAGASLEVSATTPFFDTLTKFLAGISFGGALVTDFKIIDTGMLLEVTDGTGTVLVSISSGGALTTLSQIEWNGKRNGSDQVAFAVAPSDMAAKQWNLVSKSTDALQWQNATDSVNSLTLNANGSVGFKSGTGTITGLGYFQGTGNGTYSHGCGTTPQVAWISITSGSTVTYSVGSYGATTVVVSMSASTAFRGMAII